MQFTREINRLLLGFMAIFMIIAASAAYWGIFGQGTILLREDNPRLFEAEAAIMRGAIYDRNMTVLAETTQERRRNYTTPAMNSALGYFSLRYGAGGIEYAYNDILRGDTLERDTATILMDELFQRAKRGSDIRLTFDTRVQEAAAHALQGQRGAVVVMSVPSGEVLAMVSLPTFDPNTLDIDWELLRTTPGNPFFNRVVQGAYQPGGTLQTPLLTAALVQGVSLDTLEENATDGVNVDGLEIRCAIPLPENTALTLRDAYTFACPASFVTLAEALGERATSDALTTFQLDRPFTLPGYPSVEATDEPSIVTSQFTTETLTDRALGQGQLVVSPLDMAVMVAGIINDGNAPQPYTLLEMRAPGSEVWEMPTAVRPTIPMATANTARQIQDLMRSTVVNGAAQNAGRAGVDIGGHASLAYAGDDTQAWFVGFATLGGRRGISVAVVLENSQDVGLAADIGGAALQAAHEVQNSQ